jgi:hypothetical protein
MPAPAINSSNKETVMKVSLMAWMQRLLGFLPASVRSFGPYLLVELILPGGSLFALLLWLYNHKPART